ncbi:MAG: helix-turn-helix domain-containing protein [Candidatus Nezhaarchaeota archaeon]|nr:helix-turn-helix domain-containing protein [Candidatus Nezhaarchaeota archaeon]
MRGKRLEASPSPSYAKAMPRGAKDFLLKESIRILRESGFRVSTTLIDRRSSFDLMARRDLSLLVAKAVEELDKVTEELSSELKKVASALSATPLIIASQRGGEAIEENVAYDKMGIWAVTPATLNKAVRGEGPLIYSKLGRFYVDIDGGKLKKAREQRRLSLGSLARLVGVSRKTIYEYERRSMDSTLEVAIKMEEVLEQGLATPIDIFTLTTTYGHGPEDVSDPLEKNVVLRLKAMGFKVFHFKRAPFNLIAKGEHNRLLIRVARSLDHQVKREIKVVRSLADVSDSLGLAIVEEGVSTKEGGVLSYEDLRRVKSEAELIKSIE